MSAIAYEYSDEIQGMREGLATFVKQEVISRHEKHAALLDNKRLRYAEDGRYSPEVAELIKEIRMASARAGYFAMCAPQEIGGLDLGYLAYFAAWEQVTRICGSKYWLGQHVIGHWASGPSPVLRQLTPKAQEEILPGIMSGAESMCFGLSEPGAGSDATMIRTRAEPDGDGWILNGGKIWTSHSPTAQYAIVFAVTDPERAQAKKGGISAFIVPTNSPGFQIQQIIKMWGSIGGNEAVLHFDNVRIEPHQLVGDLHSGFRIAMLGISQGRIFNCGRAIGLGRWALAQAFEYIKVRETFGNTLSEYQGVTFPLAEAATRVHAAHLLTLNVAQLLDRGLPARKELAMAKSFTTESVVKAVDTVIQTHGAMGFTNEMYLTDAYVTSRQVIVGDGTSEILKRAIVKQMLEGDMSL